MGREFQYKHNVKILQATSAKENTGIEELFMKIAVEIEQNKEAIRGSLKPKTSNASLASAKVSKERRGGACKC